MELNYKQQQDNSWQLLPEQSGSSGVIVGAKENLSISEDKIIRANALVVADATPDDSQKILKKEYAELIKNLSGKELKIVWPGLKQFIIDKRPEFIEPYYEAWNLFAPPYKLSAASAINDSRRKKFKTRISEQHFDFMKILDKIKNSTQLRGIDTNSNWKVTFDWILENDKNYLKILEGNYD